MTDIVSSPDVRIVRKQVAPEWLSEYLDQFGHLIPLRIVLAISTYYLTKTRNMRVNKVAEYYDQTAAILYFNPLVYNERTHCRSLIKRTLQFAIDDLDDYAKIFYIAYYAYIDPFIILTNSGQSNKYVPICYYLKHDSLIDRYNVLVHIKKSEYFFILKFTVDSSPIFEGLEAVRDDTTTTKRKKKKAKPTSSVKCVTIRRTSTAPIQDLIRDELIAIENDKGLQFVNSQDVDQNKRILPDAVKMLYEVIKPILMF